MAKTTKRILLVVVAVVGVLLLALGGVLFYVDSLAASAVTRGVTRALGVETRVASVDVRLLDGTVAIRELTIANPEGFAPAGFLQLADGDAEVALSSLLDDVVRVDELRLRGLDLWLVQEGTRSNWATILAHVRAREDGAPETPEEGSRVRVGKLVLEDVRANVEARLLPGAEPHALVVPIEKIELTGVIGGDGMPIADLAATVVKVVISAVLENAGGSLPPEVAAGLRLAMSPLQSLEQLGVDVVVRGAEVVRGAIEEAARRALEKVLPAPASGSAPRRDDGDRGDQR